MARKDALSKIIRNEWPAKLDNELRTRFGVEFETRFNERVVPGQFETRRVDEMPLTEAMINFIHGYMTAMNHVYIWNGRV